MDAQNTPKQLFGEIGVSLFVFYYACSILLKQDRTKNDKFHFYAIFCFSMIATIEAMYGISSFIANWISDHKIVPTCGSFNNPAGLAVLLSSVYPYLLYLLQVTKGKNRLYTYIAIAIIFIAISMSASRSGILCIISVSLLYILYRKRISLKKITIISIIPISLLIYALYTINRNSANGRLFIWARSFELIRERCFWGYGADAFKVNYMAHQADYFKNNPESAYSMIADNVQYPYNEWINLLLNYGVIGLLILTAFIICIIRCYKKNHSIIKIYAAMSCFSIALFSFFSYPFFYTCIWIVLGFNLYLIIVPLYWKFNSFLEKLHLKYIFAFCIMAFSIVFIHNRVSYINTELKWKRTHTLYINTKSHNTLIEYQKLYDRMRNNPFFLFNYANILYDQGKYNDSYIITEQAKDLWKNYDIEILSGDIENKRNNTYKAIEHYMTASNMCPAKFHPLVQIQQLYRNIGDTVSANEFAIRILNKPVKITSHKIELIKELIKHELKESRLHCTIDSDQTNKDSLL